MADMATRWYRAIAYQSPGDGKQDGWDVIFPDIPGCVSQGETALDAMKNAKEALALHIEGLIAEGIALPPESELNSADAEWAREIPMQDPVDALLETVIPGKNIRVDVTMDRALVERLDTAASREGTTRSGYLAQAVREKLQRSRERI
jgi:predicted RNase H-like HicB family nuclease